MTTITVETYLEQESFYRNQCAIRRFFQADLNGDKRKTYAFFYAELRANNAYETMFAIGRLCREINRTDLYVELSKVYGLALRSYEARPIESTDVAANKS